MKPLIIRTCWFLGGLTAGLLLFTAVEAGRASSRMAAPGAGDRASGAQGERGAQPVSTLGREALSASPVLQTIRQLMDRRRQSLEKRARFMTSSKRVEHVHALLARRNLHGGGMLNIELQDLRHELLAYIRAEDIGAIETLINSRDSGLTVTSERFLRTCLAEAAAALLPLEAVLQNENGNDPDFANETRRQVLEDAFERDPFEALALLQNSEMRAAFEGWDENVTAIFHRAALLDRARALSLAREIPDEATRAYGISGVLMAVAAQSGITEALAFSKTLGDKGSRTAMCHQMLMQYGLRGLKSQRDEVLAYLVRADSAPELRDTLHPLLSHWARREPGETWAWLDANWDKIPPDSMDEESRHDFMGTLARTSPRTLREILDTATGEKRHFALRAHVEQLAENDPRAALESAVTLPPEFKKPALTHILHQWAQSEPDQAAAYVEALPAGDPHAPDLVNAVVQSWVYMDAPGASEWLNRQPAGAAKDQGIQRLAEYLTQRDNEAAAEWSLQHTNPETRYRLQRDIISWWAVNDPATASAWIDKNRKTNTLTPEHAAELGKLVERFEKRQ